MLNVYPVLQFNLKGWILSTFWGWLLGVALVIILSSFLDTIGIEYLQFYIGLGMSIGVSFMQWASLKKIVKITPHWILKSSMGMGIPSILIDWMLPQQSSYKLTLSVSIGAAVMGFIQMLELKKFFYKSFVWFVANFLGWVNAALILRSTEYTMEMKGNGWTNLGIALLNFAIILSGGIILGYFSGKAIQKMNKLG